VQDKDLAPQTSTVSVEGEFERALGDILARVSVCAPVSVAVAYSGGLDSAALLHLLRNHAARHPGAVKPFAFHVHHGLSPNADRWLAHCRQLCATWQIAFDARRVHVADGGGNGVEEAARLRRYAALGEMCRLHGVLLLLTAHHEDDQAETVMLQLLRGAGVAGLSGMERANHAPDLLGDPQLLMGRPLLGLARADLEAYVGHHAVPYVEDESNLDPRYARNALRHRVMPVLTQCFPGFQQRFTRTAQHARTAQRLLDELASRDLATCLDGDSLDVRKLRQLDTDRIDNLLRHWLAVRGIRMPSTSWLEELRTQLLEAKRDAQLCVTHADCCVRRHRDRVFLTPRMESPVPQPSAFRWQGEPELRWPQFGGTLHFDVGGQGVDATWLRTQPLTIRLRSGGERLKLAANRPTRTLKQHYQALGVPAWERVRLPLVFAGPHLLFAAGIGMDAHAVEPVEQGVRLRWEWD